MLDTVPHFAPHASMKRLWLSTGLSCFARASLSCQDQVGVLQTSAVSRTCTSSQVRDLDGAKLVVKQMRLVPHDSRTDATELLSQPWLLITAGLSKGVRAQAGAAPCAQCKCVSCCIRCAKGARNPCECSVPVRQAEGWRKSTLLSPNSICSVSAWGESRLVICQPSCHSSDAA